jgi:hypothetical protein
VLQTTQRTLWLFASEGIRYTKPASPASKEHISLNFLTLLRQIAPRWKSEETQPSPGCIYPFMKPIEWPKSSSQKNRTEISSQVFLPELVLTDEDYEAAGEALRKLDGCFFEVVFVHEVAARHCRERQLAAELARNHAGGQSKPAHARNLIEELKNPTPLSRFHSSQQRDSKVNLPKTLP